MSRRNDISTPEGYFENLQARLLEIPSREEVTLSSESNVRGFRRLAPYVAIAASFLVAVMIGNFVLRQTTVPADPEEDTWSYVSYLASALDPDGAVPMDMADYYIEEDGLSPEDIVKYLIADGISVEQLAYLSYEEVY